MQAMELKWYSLLHWCFIFFSVIDGLIDALLLSNKQNFSYCRPLALLSFALEDLLQFIALQHLF